MHDRRLNFVNISRELCVKKVRRDRSVVRNETSLDLRSCLCSGNHCGISWVSAVFTGNKELLDIRTECV